MYNNRHGVAYKNDVRNRLKMLSQRMLKKCYFFVQLLQEKAKSNLKRIRKLCLAHILEDIAYCCDWLCHGSNIRPNVC